MKKKEYIQPEVEIVLLEQENVITESFIPVDPWGGEVIEDIIPDQTTAYGGW